MVKFSTIALAAAAAVTPVAAKNCNPGLYYCGSVLLAKGRYFNQIVEALHAAHSSTDENHVNNSLFYCDGGSNGDIHRVSFCSNGCKDGGRGHSDYC